MFPLMYIHLLSFQHNEQANAHFADILYIQKHTLCKLMPDIYKMYYTSNAMLHSSFILKANKEYILIHCKHLDV